MSGKVTTILGATSEIGRETAMEFAASGSSLLLVGRRRAALEEVTEACKRFKVDAVTLQLDLTVSGAAKHVVDVALDNFGRLDVVVSYVGYPFSKELWQRKVHELDEEIVLEVMRTDFLSAFSIAKHAIPIMRRQGNGVIILTASTPAISWHYEGAAYTFAKAAVVALVKAIAAENGQYGIRSYALALGNIETFRTCGALSEEERLRLADESPMKRWGKPKEVARVALSLATDAFSFVNGQTIVIDGGTVMLP